MLIDESLNIRDFFLSLANLLDMAEPKLAKHQIKTAFIAWQIGVELGLSVEKLNTLIIASLLHDIGALSLEEKINLHSSIYEELEQHSIKGAYILSKIDGFKEVADSVKFHHTSYSLLGEKMFLAQIINVADTVERAIDRSAEVLSQKEDINNLLKVNINKEFNPRIVEAYYKISEKECFWFDLENSNIRNFFYESPLKNEKSTKIFEKQLILLIRDIIDFKSPFTIRHSSLVMVVSKELGKIFNLSQNEIDKIEIASLLHDVGKLVIPNCIIMKPGPLDSVEKSIIKKHPYYTYIFLKEAKFKEEIVKLASFHHETHNGRGYPFKLTKERLTLSQRIITIADIFVALFEDRPYRKGMEKDKIFEILEEYTKGTKDSLIFEKLSENYEGIIYEIGRTSVEVTKHYEEMMLLK